MDNKSNSRDKMVRLIKLTKKCKNSFRDSAGNLEKFLKELFEEFEKARHSDNELFSTCIYSITHSMCEAFKNGQQNFDLFVEFLKTLGPFINSIDDKHYCKVLQLYKYLIVLFCQKNKCEVAVQFLTTLNVRSVSNESIIRTYFDLYKSAYPRVIFDYIKKIQNTDVIVIEKFKKDFISILNMTKKQNDYLFLEFMSTIFSYKLNFIMLIQRHLPLFDELLGEMFKMIGSVTNVDFNYIEVFSMVLSRILVMTASEESKHREKPVLTSKLLKVLSAHPELNRKHLNKYSIYILYFIVKLACVDSKEEFNNIMKTILGKILDFLKKYDKNELIYGDTILTLGELFKIFQNQFITYIDNDNIILILKMFVKMLPIYLILEGHDEAKLVCGCQEINKHEILNIVQFSIGLHRKAIENEFEDVLIHQYLQNIFRCAVKALRKYSCNNLQKLWIYACKCYLNNNSKIANPKFAPYVLHVLDSINNMKGEREQTIYVFGLLIRYKAHLALEEYKNALNYMCLYIAWKINDDPQNLKNRHFEINTICNLYEKANINTDKTICDLLDEIDVDPELFPKPEQLDRELLLDLQFKICTTFCSNYDLKEKMFQKIIINSKNIETFTNAVYHIGHESPQILKNCENKIQSNIEKFKKKIEFSIKIINLEDEIVLVKLYVSQFIFEVEKMKKVISIKTVNEKSFENMDINEFKKIKIDTETKILNIVEEIYQIYSKLFKQRYPLLKQRKLDWNLVLKDLSLIGFHLKLRGHFIISYKFWDLCNQIASTINNSMYKIQALTFLLDHFHLVKKFDKSLNMNKEIENMTKNLLEYLQILESMKAGDQNSVLNCLLKIVFYYDQMKEHKCSKVLMKLVRLKVNNITERKNKFEVINATIYSMEFYKSIKCDSDEGRTWYRYIEELFTRLRQITYVSSKDILIIVNLLIEVCVQIARFLLNRSMASIAKTFLYFVLKFTVDLGLSCRFGQILQMIADIDLQMEAFNKYEINSMILDVIFGKKSFSLPKIERSPRSEEEKISDILEIPANLFLEQPRKVKPRPVSPLNVKSPVYEENIGNMDMNEMKHEKKCNCSICQNEYIQLLLFSMEGLQGRSLRLIGNYDEAKKKYENALEFWNENIKIKNGAEIIYCDYLLNVFIGYIKILRILEKFTEAKKVIRLALSYCHQFENLIDVSYINNLMEQDIAVEYCITKDVKNTNDNPEVNSRFKEKNNNMKNVKKILNYSPDDKCNKEELIKIKPDKNKSEVFITEKLSSNVNCNSKTKETNNDVKQITNKYEPIKEAATLLIGRSSRVRRRDLTKEVAGIKEEDKRIVKVKETKPKIVDQETGIVLREMKQKQRSRRKKIREEPESSFEEVIPCSPQKEMKKFRNIEKNKENVTNLPEINSVNRVSTRRLKK